MTTKPIADIENEAAGTRPRLDQPRVQSSTPAGRLQLAGKLGQLSLPRQVFVLAIWPLLEQIMAYLVGTVDIAIAGHLKDQQVEATGALGLAGFIIWLVTILAGSMGVGATALIARATGARHKSLANNALGQSLTLSLAFGLVTMIALSLLARPVGQFIGLTGVSLDMSTRYLQIIALAAPCVGILLVGNASLRGAGDTQTPFFIMIGLNIINTSLSLLFVFGPAPLGGHGVPGIAAGTAISWALGAVTVIVVLIKGLGGIQLHLHRLKPHAHTIKRLLNITAPSVAESIGAMWLANFIVLKFIDLCARHIDMVETKVLLGPHMIAIRIESISFMSGFAFATAATTLTGQYLGLGDPHRARKATMHCFTLAAIIMTTLGVIFITFPRQLASIMTNDPGVLELTIRPIQICGAIQLFFAMSMVFSGAIRGAGDTRMALILTAVSVYAIRIPAVWFLAIHLEYGFLGLWFAICGELVIRGLIYAARFAQGGWAKIKV